jgi:predicted nucleotidyltransferase
MFPDTAEAMETKIVEHLTAKWSPEVILLGGSRADGSETLGSDWDLYLVGPYASQEFFPERFRDEHLDVELRPPDSLPSDILKIYYGPVPWLRILKDNSENFGSRIVEATRKAHDVGPTPKNSDTLAMDRSEMERMVAKIAAHAIDSEACFTNLGFFHRMAIQFWFERNGRWSLPPHKALPIVRKEDPDFAENLKVVASADNIHSRIEACGKIQQKIWGT